MNTLLQIFYRPKAAFQALKDSEKFPTMSLIFLLIIVTINNILMIPVTTKVSELTLSTMAMQIGEDQMEYASLLLYKMRYLTVIFGIFSYGIMLLIYTLLIWIISKISKCTLSFQKTFELMIHCCFVIAIGSLINTLLLYGQGIENIDSIYKVSLTGLNLLTTPESVGVTLYTFLTLINPFQIWFLFLLTVGAAVLADIKYSKAYIISFILWAIITLYPVVMIYISQTLLQSKGLI